MADSKLRFWSLTLQADVPKNISPPSGGVDSVGFAIQNQTSGVLLVGDSNSQIYQVGVGGTYEVSQIDRSLDGTHSEFSSEDIYVLSELGGELVVVSVQPY